MKKIIMTISVFVDDNPVFNGEICPPHLITKSLYDHIGLWEFNEHGTVEVIDEQIIDNAVIGID